MRTTGTFVNGFQLNGCLTERGVVTWSAEIGCPSAKAHPYRKYRFFNPDHIGIDFNLHMLNFQRHDPNDIQTYGMVQK